MIFKSINFVYTNTIYHTSHIMMLVCLAAIPGITTQIWFFGWGTLLQIFLGITSSLFIETVALRLRKTIHIRQILNDKSALLTGLLLAVSVPPLAPWWILVLGSIFAIIIAKQLYGGLGHNIFNPAMIGYVMLLVSFPIQMTNYCFLSNEISSVIPNFMNTFRIIFSNYTASDSICTMQINESIDGISQATPLSILKKHSYIVSIYDIEKMNIPSLTYNNALIYLEYWKYVNLSWLLGGIFLLWKKVIQWYIPISFLVILMLCATISYFFLPLKFLSPKLHLFSGATMLGAFFILTDPVTAPIAKHGRLIFGSIAGLIVWIIRSFGSYADSVAFAVLLANITVPLIDYHTLPKIKI